MNKDRFLKVSIGLFTAITALCVAAWMSRPKVSANPNRSFAERLQNAATQEDRDWLIAKRAETLAAKQAQQEAAAIAAEAAKPKTPTVHVQLDDNAVKVTNLDNLDWPSTTIHLDGVAFGYRINTYPIPAGKTVMYHLKDFTTRRGERFNPRARVPKEIIVHPEGWNARVFNY